MEPENPEGTEVNETITDIEKTVETEVLPDADLLEPEKKNGVQKKIDKLTRQRREAREEAAYWKGIADGKAQQPKEELQDVEPYEIDAAYIDAQVEKKIKEKEQSIKTRERATNINTQYEKGRDAYDDFDEVAIESNVIKTQDVFEAVEATGDMMPDTMYYLGSNPKEAARLHGLSPIRLGMEIAKIQDKLKRKQAPGPKITNAPEPHPKSVKSGSTVIVSDISKMTKAERAAKWEADRRAQHGRK